MLQYLHTLPKEEKEQLGLPSEPNFEDKIPEFKLSQESFQTGQPTSCLHHDLPTTFWGFLREKGRGVGTRNYIILISVCSSANGFVKTLENRFSLVTNRARTAKRKEIEWDGVVAITHTEGGEDVALSSDGSNPNSITNNKDKVLRTLFGFAVHPNVGAVLFVDRPGHVISNNDIKHLDNSSVQSKSAFSDSSSKGKSLEGVLHAFVTIGKESWSHDLAYCLRIFQVNF